MGIANRLTAVLVLSAFPAFAQGFPQGQVIPRAIVKEDATQSYALYLPSGYDPARRWPVIFIFEPLARGRLPVSLARQAAEKYGYVLVASNNAHNGPLGPQIDAGNAMWKDAHQRLALDPRRTYFAGFSGGSRLAVLFATLCKDCAAGVIASGAAFPTNLEVRSAPRFLYFGSFGDEDFNFPEYVEIEPKLRKAGFTYHLRQFDGGHQWAPPEVWAEALEWFNLQAMKAASIPRDEKFINDSYSRALTTAASEPNDLAKFRGYEQAARDFIGLVDISDAQKHAAALQRMKTVKDLIRREERDVSEQRLLTAPLEAQIAALEDPERESGARLQLHRLFAELQSLANNEKNPHQLAASRARMQEIIHIYENGAQMIADKNYSGALRLYDILVGVNPRAPGAHVQKSRIYLLMNDRSKAIGEAQAAVKDGIDPDAFRDSEFDRIRTDPAFIALLNSLQPAPTE
jgi:dienelactone hydrolase